MKKRAAERTLAHLPGFRKFGAYFIGTCSDDVMAGYAIDAPPNGLYVFRFALPSYDNINFLHLALGRRIYDIFEHNDLDLNRLMLDDWAGFGKMTNREELLDYISRENIGGTYAIWTKYLTYIRNQQFKRAEQLEARESAGDKFMRLPMIAEGFKSLSTAKSEQGWSSCNIILDSWLSSNRARYCNTGADRTQ